MKSIFRSIVAIAALAIAAAASVTANVVTSVYAIARGVRDRAIRFIVHAVEVVAVAAAAVRDAVVLFIAAKSFVQRIVRRERLHVTPGWRLCPSI